MPTTELIRNLTLRANTQGFAEAKAAMDAFATAQGKVSDGARVLATTTDSASKKTLSVVGGLERLAAGSDAAYKTQQRLTQQIVLLDKAMAQGLGGSREFGIVLDSVNKTQRELTAVNDNVARSHVASANAATLNRMQLMELGHVGRSVADMLMAGASPLQALSVEGSRIVQVFTEGNGGVVGTLKAVGSAAIGFINPLALGATAVIGLGAAALYAASSYRTMQEQMDRAVMGAGRAAGLSGTGLNALAGASSATTGVSIGDSRSNAAALAATGKFDPSNITGIMGLTKGYASAFGTDYSEAGGKLADIFSDPSKGAEALNRTLGFLDDRTRQYIRTLQAQGDQQGAVKVLIDASKTSMAEQVQQLGFWGKAWEEFKRDNDTILGVAGRATSGPTPQQLYTNASRAGGAPGMLGYLQSRGLYDDGTGNIAEDFRHAGMLAGASPIMMSQRDTVNAGVQSGNAADVIRSIVPDIMVRQEMLDQRNKLQTALGTPGVNLDPAAARAASEAMDRLNIGLATFTTSAEKMRQDSAYHTASITADDAATKLLIDTQGAYAKTLRDTRDASLAAATAETMRAEAVANATKKLDDMVVSLNDQAKLIGLNPTQKIEEERRQALATITRDIAIPGGTSYRSTGGSLTGGFDASVNRTLGFEGGLLARDTNGTPSNFGINQAAFPGIDVTKLTRDQAIGLYRKNYWNPLNLDAQSPGMQRVAFDTSVMEGPSQAAKFMKQSGGDADQFMDLRQKFEADLIAKNPAKYGRFGTSWANRDASLRLDLGKSGTMEGSTPLSGTDTSGAVNSTNALFDSRRADLYNAPFKAANDNLGAMDRANAASAGSFGMSADKVAGLNERLKVENELIAAGATSLDPYKSKLDDVQQRWTDATKAAEEYNKRVADIKGAMDDVRGLASGALSSFTSDMLAGKGAAEGLHDALGSITNRLASMAENGLMNMLLGAPGSNGSGSLLGSGLFSAFSALPKFASGTDYAPGGSALVGENGPEIVKLPQGSQVTPNDQLGGGAGGDLHVHVYGGSGDSHIRTLVQQGVNAGIAQNNGRLPGMLQDLQKRSA